MFIPRKNLRYPSQAQVKIAEVLKGEGILKDISITGCCIECTMYEDIKPQQIYTIEVIPEKASHVRKFEFTAEARWIRDAGSSWEVGFYIASSPTGKLFQRYVDYLNWRATSNGEA